MSPQCAPVGTRMVATPIGGRKDRRAGPGIVDGEPRLDLHYDDDVRADTDMNVVMTGAGKFVEVQGTAEGEPFAREELDALLALAAGGIARLIACQREALAAA